MRRTASQAATTIVTIVACLVVLGCAAPPATPEGRREVTDPCAARLHDLAGCLLHYFAVHGAMPDDLKQLQVSAGVQEMPPLVCPVSQAPYVYHKDGIALEGSSGRLVLHDAEPVHDGGRWGLVLTTPGRGGAVTAYVLLFDEESMPVAK